MTSVCARACTIGAWLALAPSMLVACGASPVVVATPEGTSTDPSSPKAEPKPSQAPSASVALATSTPGPASTSSTSSATPSTSPSLSTAPAEPPPKEISARHVLVQYLGTEHASAAVVRTREQAEALAEKVLAKARRGESFTRLATEYSDEPGAAGRGGALGKFTRGKMTPSFEDAAFRLKVGQISDVVETPFGFHIILRTE